MGLKQRRMLHAGLFRALHAQLSIQMCKHGCGLYCLPGAAESGNAELGSGALVDICMAVQTYGQLLGHKPKIVL